MALLLSTNGPGIRDLPSGTGHVLINHSGCKFKGQGPGKTVIRVDGTYVSAFQAGAPAITGTEVSDCTIDLDGHATSLTGFITDTTYLRDLVTNNVEIINSHRAGTGIVNGGQLTTSGLYINGDGGGVQSTLTSTLTKLRSTTIRGGRFGFVLTDGGQETWGTVPGIDIDGMDIDHAYWQSPTYEEVTVTGFTANRAYVESHAGEPARAAYDCFRVLTPAVTFDSERSLRSQLARVGDRIETADRKWTEVTGFGPDGMALLDDWHAAGSFRRIPTPSALATVYRLTLGRSFYYGADFVELYFVEGSHWRDAQTNAITQPAMVPGVRMDIIRHGYIPGQTRDVDTGGITVNRPALNATVRRVSARRGFSDQISVRGVGGITEFCSVADGQDMGITATAHAGPQIVRRCQSMRSGMFGFYLAGGPSRLESCTAGGNGRHGYHGYGVAADIGDGVTTTDSFVQVRDGGMPNVTAMLANLEPQPGGFERPQPSRRSRSHRRRFT